MKYAKPALVSAVLIGLMLAASAWAWPLVGDQPIAVHFDLNGQPNGYASKGVALLLTPAVAAGLSLLLAVLPPLMPQRARLERSWGAYTTMWMALIAFLLLIHGAILARAVGTPLDMARIVLVAMGLLFAVLGNLLGKVRYNYVFGVRTPWTLSNERVWDRTHRFAGWFMVIGGIAAAGLGLLAPMGPLYAKEAILACLLVPLLAAVVYSYVESRRLADA